MGSSQTRARTRVPCIGRQILNHCATREAPPGQLFKIKGLRVAGEVIPSTPPFTLSVTLRGRWVDPGESLDASGNFIRWRLQLQQLFQVQCLHGAKQHAPGSWHAVLDLPDAFFLYTNSQGPLVAVCSYLSPSQSCLSTTSALLLSATV